MLAGRPLVPVFGDITIEVASILKMSDAAEEVASKVLSDYLLYWYISTNTDAEGMRPRRLRARCHVYLLYLLY
jgi:hypothetical protein